MFGAPPWDEDDHAAPAPKPAAAPGYKPVSKARRETNIDQNELPFDVDD